MFVLVVRLMMRSLQFHHVCDDSQEPFADKYDTYSSAQTIDFRGFSV